MRTLYALFVFAGLVVCGCDSGSNNRGGTDAADADPDAAAVAQFVSCDSTLGGTHSCYTSTWVGSASVGTGISEACSMEQGMTVASCSSSGAGGGCRIITTPAGMTITELVWYYNLTADQVMTICSQGHGTFVSP